MKMGYDIFALGVTCLYKILLIFNPALKPFVYTFSWVASKVQEVVKIRL